MRDVARALVDLATTTTAPGRVVNVGSDVETPVATLARLVRDVAGSRSEIRHVPFGDVFPDGFSELPRRVPSVERLRAAIGWVPQTPLRAIVEDVVAYERAAAGVADAAATSATHAS